MRRWQKPWMVEHVISSSAASAALRLSSAARPRGRPGKRDTKLGWDVAVRERAHEGPDPDQQLARGELGEGHGGDVTWAETPACQQQGDAAGHDSGLAGAGAGLDQEGAVVNSDGVPSGSIV